MGSPLILFNFLAQLKLGDILFLTAVQKGPDLQRCTFFRINRESTSTKATLLLFLLPFLTPNSILLKMRDNTATACPEKDAIYRDTPKTWLKISFLTFLFKEYYLQHFFT